MLLSGEISVALVVGFGAFLVVALILSLTHQVTRKPLEKPLAPKTFVGIAVLFLAMAVLEEVMFRWLLIGEFSRVVGTLAAFLISVVLFTVAHRGNAKLNFGAILNLVLVGMALGLTYLHWGLWVVSAAHAGWNLAQWGLGYAVSGQKTRTIIPSPAIREVVGEPYGPEAHGSATLVLMVAVVVMLAVTYGRPF